MASPLATALMTAESLPRTQIAPTDVGGIYNANYQAKMDAYKAKLAQKNAMWGGLAGLGGAGISAFGKDIGGGIKGMFGGGADAGAAEGLAGAAAPLGGASVADAMAAAAAPEATAAGTGIMATIGELLPFLAFL